MKFALIALALVSFNSFAAEKILLTCGGTGAAISTVELLNKDGKDIIRVQVSEAGEGEQDHAPVAYALKSSLRNIAKGDSDTLVGLGANSEPYGGADSNAILLRVKDGQKSAFLAMNGNVYNLACGQAK